MRFSLIRHSSSGAMQALAAAAALMGLSGCASLTTPAVPATPLTLPAQWSVQPRGTEMNAMPSQAGDSASRAMQADALDASLAPWWNAFNDAALTGLVTQALQANTSVRSAQAALRQARALRDVSAAQRGPVLGASASAQRSQVGRASPGNTWRAGFDASWEPDVFGGLRATESASEAEVQAAAASLGQVRVSLAAEVAVSYIELRGLQARLAIARSNLAAQLETLQITDWRMQAGLASSLDLEQAKTASAQTQAQIPALETGVAQAFNALSVLTGQPPGRLPATLAQGAVPQPPERLALRFPADTLRQRPDVRAAEHQITAALATVDQANAARYPNFGLSGTLGWGALRAGSLFDAASLTRSLLASVSAAVFDGGAARARVWAQQAALEQARLAHEAAVLNALQDVEDALVALQGDRQRLERLQAAAEAAANADLLARNRYASGLIDFRTVLDTQRTLLSAQSELASVRATWSADHVRLYKALGGGWVPDA